METSKENFYRLCRTCKCESNDMVPIFKDGESDPENARIDEMLMALASVQVNCNDGLPSVMCLRCSEQLRNAFTFKQQCEKVDRSFRELLKERRVIKEESHISENELNSNIFNDVRSSEKQVDEGLDDSRNDDDSISNIKEEDLIIDGRSDFIEFLENNQLILTCRECLKVFTTIDGLRCHKRLHSGAMFECKVCGKEYTRQNHLQRHELSHSRKKVHVCKICNKTLTRYDHLKRHLTIHLKEKPYSCQSCGRGFNRAEHLANHLKKCKGDPVHTCDICNKSFNREDSLVVHKHLHENKMPVLPTLETLDNIEEHYLEIDYDGISVFSDNSDNECETNEMTETVIENAIEIGESNEQVLGKEVIVMTESPEAGKPIEGSNEETINIQDMDLVTEKTEIFNDDDEDVGDNGDQVENEEQNGSCLAGIDNDSDSSTHSEYLPFKHSPKLKRGRGRPRKSNFTSYKPSGRPRGRPRIKQEVNIDDSEEFGEFSCSVCFKVYTKKSLWKRHEQKHEIRKYRCDVCNKLFSRSNHLKRHMSSHSEDKPFLCETCNKCFSRRDHLTKHMRLHLKPLDFICDICNRSFNRSDHLAKHKAAKHNIGEKVFVEKKFKCSICMKGFTTEKYRDIHMKGHNGEKRFRCKTCDKTFISKSHLNEHVKFHSDTSKKFLCSECGQRFIRNDYLVIHMRRHRGEKPFKCKYCGKGFPRTTDLTVHERYHTGEKTHLCTICGRGFGRAYNLTVHMRTHTGEKPYQCTYCEAAFAQGNDLKAHIRRHTGERFHCELCTESFLMGYLLTQHKRVVHGLNVVSNIRRLQPVKKLNSESNPDEPEPISIPLPAPVVSNPLLQSQIESYPSNYEADQITPD